MAVHPLNDWFHAQLIIALNKPGCRSEALRAYQTVRNLLRHELGLEPSPELWELHHKILAADSRARSAHSPIQPATRRVPAHRTPAPAL
ncbi:BTAD domain-containing putative transcriptional regulator [Streptomyces sp. NPDC002742]|uniref:BTAD domain-containing putative transcriptional regulator n=1 Tax=Streptomyces sp. NPDC002742 TaxID=3364663 RepID=UPI0036869474